MPNLQQEFCWYKSLKKHKNLHDTNYLCEVCLRCFGGITELTDHMRTHTGEKPIMCSTWGKRFAQKSSLQRHQVIHSDESNFKCKICQDDKYFKTKGQLSIHMHYHFEPKHTCVHCNKKFHTSTNLTYHIKLHLEPANSCVNCGKKFHTSTNLKGRMKIHFNRL